MAGTGNVTTRSRMVPAWDLPTRIFHWLLVALVVSSWVSFEFAEALGDPRLVWHRWNGLAILSLLVWRLLWGIWGSSTSRFALFVHSPAAVAAYARSLPSASAQRFLGHNPAGGVMVLALIGTMLVMAVLGLFSVEENDLATGPLYPLAGDAAAKEITRWHRYLFEPVLLVLVGVHIAANVLYGAVKKEPLIPAMVTGSKPAAPYQDAAAASIVPNALWRALLTLVAAKVIVFGTILALGGRLW